MAQDKPNLGQALPKIGQQPDTTSQDLDRIERWGARLAPGAPLLTQLLIGGGAALLAVGFINAFKPEPPRPQMPRKRRR